MARWNRPVLIPASLALLTGCQPARAPSASDPPAPVSVWIEPEAEFSWSEDHGVCVAESPAKERQCVRSGYRFTLSAAGDTTWAPERFSSAIVSATPVKSGWVFIARDGTVTRADTFLGDLWRLGEIPEMAVEPILGTGRAAVATRHGEIYSTDGTKPVEKLSLPPGARSYVGAFATADRGALVTEGGGLIVTSDGGSTWKEVWMDGASAWRVDLGSASASEPTATGLPLLVTTSRSVALVGDGKLEPIPAGTLASTGVSWLPGRVVRGHEFDGVPGSEDGRLAESFWSKFPRAAEVDPNLIVRGETALYAEVGKLVTIDLKTGKRRMENTALVPKDRGCAVDRWGNSAVALCSVEDSPSHLFHSSDWLSFAEGLSIPDAVDVVFSDDAAHAAWGGPCDGSEPEEGKAPSVCAYSIVASRELPVAAPSSVVGIRGAKAVISDGSPASPEFRLLDLESGALSRPIVPSASPGQPVIRSLDWMSGDKVAGIARPSLSSGLASPFLVLGAPDQTLSVQPLPAGALSVGFIDDQRGVAAGEKASELWYTLDGGRSWQPAKAHLEGDPSGLVLGEKRTLVESNLHCEADRCGNARFSVTFAPNVDGGRPMIGRSRAVPEDNFDLHGRGGHGASHAQLCTMHLGDAAPPRDPRPKVVPPVQETRTVDGATQLSKRVVTVGRGAVSMAIEIGTSPDHPVALTWSGGSARSGKTFKAGPSPLQVASPIQDSTEVATYALLASDSQQAFVERCTRDDEEHKCELLVGIAGKGVVLAATLDGYSMPANSEEMASAVTFEGGGGEVLFSATPAGYADRITLPVLDVVLVLGTDGKVATRRDFAWSPVPHHHSGLARKGGIFGYAVTSDADAARYAFYPMQTGQSTGPAPLVESAAIRLSVCQQEPRPEADQLWLAERIGWFGIDSEGVGEQEGVGTFDLGETPCLRSFDTVLSAEHPSRFKDEKSSATAIPYLHLTARQIDLGGSATIGGDVREAECVHR